MNMVDEKEMCFSLNISCPCIYKFRFAGVETYMQSTNLDLMLQKSPLYPNLHAFSMYIKFRLFKEQCLSEFLFHISSLYSILILGIGIYIYGLYTLWNQGRGQILQ